MKGGGTVPVKESITLPDDALRAEGWYRTALDNPNRVTILQRRGNGKAL